jgi:hypothetical protein
MKTFVVLGMHRSATSLAAQGLHKCGVHMGERLLGAHQSNKYGHYEDIDFVHFNEKILKLSGGSWHSPPDENRIISIGKENAGMIESFIESKKRDPFWGWKDPRTVLTIKCYMPFLVNPHFIACYRRPKSIAASLYKRDNMPLDKGIRLAGIYNERMKKFLQEFSLCESS